MKSRAILYVPSDTPEAMVMATLKVAGVPLIVRGVMTLFLAGVQKVTLLIAASQEEKILRFLRRFKKDRVPEINIVTYDEPYSVTPSIISMLQQEVDNEILFINANLLFDHEIIDFMLSGPVSNNEVIVCNEGVHRIPIIKTSRFVILGLKGFVEEKPRSIESCVKFLTERTSLQTVQKPNYSNTFLVHRPRERILAEKFLAETIRLTTNGPVAKYINKRLSLPVSVFFSKFWISPHAVTAFNIVIGLMSGVFMAGKGYLSLLIGAGLFQIASIADGVDGELSKLTFRSSKFGQIIDTVSDNLALASCLIGLTIGVGKIFNQTVAFSAGILAILNTAFVIWLMARYLKKHTNSASLATFNKVYLKHLPPGTNFILVWFLDHFKYFAMKDCFAFLIFLFAVFDILPLFLFLITFGTSLAAISIGYLQLARSNHVRHSCEETVSQFPLPPWERVRERGK